MKEYFTYNPKSPLLIELLELMGKVKDVEDAASVLNWDQETYMPPGAAEPRAYQISALEVLSHSILTSEYAREMAKKIRDVEEPSDNFEASMFRLFLREHERAIKLPENFIQDYTKAKTLAIESWKNARSKRKFSYFVKDLTRILEFKIQEAEYLGYEENRYDALLDFYEPGMTVSKLKPIFSHLQQHALDTLTKIEPYKEKISDDFIKQKFNAEGQMKFIRNVAKKMAFDFYYGRIDKSIHPFTISFSPKDVRVTTRINENEIRAGIYAAIHELGHALYEQGKDYLLIRTFADDGSSYGMHESQSLIWENIITRTREFWMWGMPLLQEIFPGQLSNKFPTDMYKAVNIVRPSFIRTEADELTYNLHIIFRFDIENLLLNGDLAVADIPSYWDKSVKQFVGVYPPDDLLGALQDIHWAHGSFGYFPIYTLGKLYAAMIWKVMQEDIPEIKEKISNGQFAVLRNWLRNKIHIYGKLVTPNELIKDVAGESLNETAYIEYMDGKIKDLYFK
jgi:carboxypeptidase Taq